jgi:hypothetical protein
MPGVPEPDCRVKPEVRSFNRLGPTSRVAQYLLARNFDPTDQNALMRSLHVQAGAMTPPRRAHDPPLGTQTYFSRGARFASYSGPVR